MSQWCAAKKPWHRWWQCRQVRRHSDHLRRFVLQVIRASYFRFQVSGFSAAAGLKSGQFDQRENLFRAWKNNLNMLWDPGNGRWTRFGESQNRGWKPLPPNNKVSLKMTMNFMKFHTRCQVSGIFCWSFFGCAARFVHRFSVEVRICRNRLTNTDTSCVTATDYRFAAWHLTPDTWHLFSIDNTQSWAYKNCIITIAG